MGAPFYPTPPPTSVPMAQRFPTSLRVVSNAEIDQREADDIATQQAAANTQYVGLLGFIRNEWEIMRRHRDSAAGWTERLLAWLGLPLRQRLAIAVLVAAASASFDLILGLVTLGDAFLTIAWLVPYFKREKWTLFKGLVATVIVIAGVLVFVFNLQTRRSLESMSSSGSGGIASVAQKPMLNREQKDFGEEAAQQQGALNINSVAKAEGGNAVFGYQGLPARFEIPGGERHSYFGQELLATDREHAITVFLVSSTIVWLIGVSFRKAWMRSRASGGSCGLSSPA